jgi:uncharacterized protein YjbJ (UPF0337 family)
MNWDVVKGKWKQLKGETRKEWGQLTDDDHEKIAGNKDLLVGKLQEKYGWAKEYAENKVNEWASKHGPTPSSS